MVRHASHKTRSAFGPGCGTVGHRRKENPGEGWLMWLEGLHSPRAEETGNVKKSKCMYKIKDRNRKPLNSQVCVIQRLNRGNWNSKRNLSDTRHYQLFFPRYKLNSLETEDSWIWKEELDKKGQRTQQSSFTNVQNSTQGFYCAISKSKEQELC